MKRLPIIRHIRYFIHLRRMNQHYALWAAMGSHDGNRHLDEEVLQDIWEGKE